MTKDKFVAMYQDLFPEGDATNFAMNVFRTFDENKDGMLSFDVATNTTLLL